MSSFKVAYCSSGQGYTLGGELELLSEAESVVGDDEDEQKSDTVCLTDVPSHMIPQGLIKFFDSSLSQIVSMRILRSFKEREKYLALIRLHSPAAAATLVKNFHGRRLSSLNPAVFCLHFVKNVDEEQQHLLQGLEKEGSSSSVSATGGVGVGDTSSIFQQVEVQSLSPASGPLVSITTTTTAAIAAGSSSSRSGPRLEDSCSVCLESIERTTQSFTGCCNHKFHIACIAQLMGPQCPLCRFQHDAVHADLSQCSTCGWDGLSSSGSSSSESEAVVGGESSHSHHQDLWVCLVCGFMGCGVASSHQSHIREHYTRHLHTYAMNVGNKSVWDFAGDGYVHRLVLHRPDEADEAGVEATLSTDESAASAEGQEGGRTAGERGWRAVGGMCLEGVLAAASVSSRRVERPDVAHVSAEHGPTARGRAPLLSAREEEYLVNVKLESAASYYNNVLVQQLEENRILYEARLAAVGARASVSIVSPSSSSRSAPEPAGLQGVIHSLVSERSKLQRQCQAARERQRKAAEGVDLLHNLNGRMEGNLVDWRAKTKKAEERMVGAEEAYRQQISALEHRLRESMQKIEASAAVVKDEGSSSSSSSSSSSRGGAGHPSRSKG